VGVLPRPAPDSGARIEDLEEALRRIVVVLQPDRRYDATDRDWAALAIACDALDIDVPLPLTAVELAAQLGPLRRAAAS
jgi:hypothetical protein